MSDESMTLAQVRARLHEADLMEQEIAALKDRVRSLQSQLAWTPVSDGLPTEPGTYEFLSHALHIHVFTLEADITTYPWVMIGVDERWDATEIEVGYTDYRRIELPNGD
jgi:hypothetical protein